MPSVTQKGPTAINSQQGHIMHGTASSTSASAALLAKKRRWDGPDDAASSNVLAILVSNCAGDDAAMQGSNNIGNCINGHHAFCPPTRKILPIKRVRLDTSDDCRLRQQLDRTLPSAASTTPASSALLHPCHICHRAPRRKCDLNSLADCEGCGQRTCFVCLRECLGWEAYSEPRRTATTMTATTTATAPPNEQCSSGQQLRAQRRHNSTPSFSMTDAARDESEIAQQSEEAGGNDTLHNQPHSTPYHTYQQHHEGDDSRPRPKNGHCRMICSQCCVERGPDGDVVCLGCLPYVEG